MKKKQNSSIMGPPPKWPFVLAGIFIVAACLQGGIALFSQEVETGISIAKEDQTGSQSTIIEVEKAKVDRQNLSKNQSLLWAGLLAIFALVAGSTGIVTYFHSDTKADMKEAKADMNRRFDKAERERAELKAELKAEFKAEMDRRFDELKELIRTINRL